MNGRRILGIIVVLIVFVLIIGFFFRQSLAAYLPDLNAADLGRAFVLITTVLASLATIVEFGLQRFRRQTKAFTPPIAQEKRNRQQLIQNVKATWIEGVRNQALYESVWIELGLQAAPEQVNRPWHMAWQTESAPPIDLAKTPIKQLFRQQAAHTLLILGKPGSGKTVTLLDLAQALIDEAEQDPDAAVPVIFNLSSWAAQKQSLYDWLLNELDITYSVPEKIGRHWLDHDALILLLDGLDEVAEEQRQACVAVINAYRQLHLVITHKYH